MMRISRGPALLLLALAAITFATTTEARNKNGLEIAYEGLLQDADRKPIAGVFPLEFRIYQTPDSKAPIWRESHWVAVVDGKYQLALGKDRTIRPTLVKPGNTVYLGVNLQDGAELTREPLIIPGGDAKDEKKQPDDVKPKEEPKAQTPKAEVPSVAKVEKPGTANKDAPKYEKESSFAEVARRAESAENADNADKLGGKTLAELEEEMERLSTRISELRKQQRDNGDNTGSVSLGSDSQILQRVGGTGGGPYVRECPPGHVVTGIRGTAGALLDSIQIICTPLQTR